MRKRRDSSTLSEVTPLRFQLVPFGETAPPAAVSCDGLVPGAVLHLSHWAGNRTPEPYRRDTSTESALAFAAGKGDPTLEVVVNNHVDTDGILSAWALVRPELAQRHATLLVAAAEAGDFDEWPREERGLWLDAAVRRLASAAGDEASAYPALFLELDALCRGLESRRELWEDEWRNVSDALVRAQAGAVSVTSNGRGVALFVHRPDEPELPGPVLHRLAPAGSTRWLLAFDRGGGAYDYILDRPRHAWADTVVRPRLPAPPREALAALGDDWSSAGDLGMTALARTKRPVRESPDAVAERVV